MSRLEFYFNKVITLVLLVSLLLAAPVLIFWTFLFDNLLGGHDA